MRERRPGDWKIDLARRHPLERTVEAALDAHRGLHRLSSSLNSMDRLDYQVLGPGERLCEIELKAKHHPYQGWAALRPDVGETDLFIVDELTIRKLLSAGRYGFLLVNDQPAQRWLVWSLMDLVFSSKVRVNRRLATGADRIKAKVLLDNNDTDHHHTDLAAALTGIATLVTVSDQRWNDIQAWPADSVIPTIGAAS